MQKFRLGGVLRELPQKQNSGLIVYGGTDGFLCTCFGFAKRLFQSLATEISRKICLCASGLTDVKRRHTACGKICTNGVCA